MLLFVLLGYVQIVTSVLSIFYTTATFPRQVRLHLDKDKQIETLSKATLALLVWRTLIVGSRILAFVLFATVFQYWLFAVVGFHYLLIFVMVFYQLRLSKDKLLVHVVYTVITPLVYVFDFCINWLAGPTFYWYLICYVPMYVENVLMSVLVLWSVSTTPSPAWYIVPGCVSVILMFPMGILAQLAYYRRWHPNVALNKLWCKREKIRLEDGAPTLTEWLQPVKWSKFRDKIRNIYEREKALEGRKPPLGARNATAMLIAHPPPAGRLSDSAVISTNKQTNTTDHNTS